MKHSLILIKIGGSIITHKNIPRQADIDQIKKLGLQLYKAQRLGYPMIISHGSGSFGHVSASLYQTANGIKNKKQLFGLSVVQQDAFQINRIVNQLFLKIGLKVLSFPPSSFCLATNKKLKSIYIEPIVYALKNSSIPLIFGDIIIDSINGCCIFSGETSLDHILKKLLQKKAKIDKVIQVGDTDGVYDLNGQTIRNITPKNIKSYLPVFHQNKHQFDVTGGMLHKVQASLEMAKTGVNVFIINGRQENSLIDTITNHPPTNSTLISKV